MATLRLVFCLLAAVSAAALHADVQWRRIDSSPGGVLPPPPAQVEPTACVALDVDHDGTAEFIIGGRNAGPALTLWRYAAGRWTTEVIEPDAVRIEAGGVAADIDGDGNTDVVFGGDYKSGEIWWWQNPFPAHGRWIRHTLKRDAMTQQHDQLFGDFDGDGKPELVAWNQRCRALLWLHVPANPRTAGLWRRDTIYARSEGIPPEGLAAADIDGDGVTDIVGGGFWFKHLHGATFAANAIDAGMGFSRAAVGQLVPGGRPEVVFSPGDADGPVKWYQWDNGAWQAHTLEPHITHGHSLQIADIDGDGNLDVLVAEMGSWTHQVDNPNARVLVFYGDGHGHFRRQVVSTGQGVHEARLADVNGDGRLDIIGKPFRHNTPKLVIWLNQGTMTAVPARVSPDRKEPSTP